MKTPSAIQRSLRSLAHGTFTLAFIVGVVAQICAQNLVIKAGAMVSPETNSISTKQMLLIEGGKIKAIGVDLTVPPGMRVVDLSNYSVLPGLIDAHTHLCATVDNKWDLGDFWIMALQRRQGFRAILGAKHAAEMLDSGFTTVRDVGNAGDYLDADLEKAIRFGVVPGPTVVFAGRIIAPYGGQFWDTPADRQLLQNSEYSFADSHDELRRAIRENIYMGAKVIKIVVDAQEYTYSGRYQVCDRRSSSRRSTGSRACPDRAWSS